MPNYQKGKIYKIIADTDEEYEPYIGSTIQTLSNRMSAHRSNYKSWKKKGGKHIRSYDLFDKFGVEKCKIILVEEYSCDSYEKLLSRERHWFDTIKCCNKRKPKLIEEELSNYSQYTYQRTLELHPNHIKDQYQRALELHSNYNQEKYQKAIEKNPNESKDRYQRTLELHPNHPKELYQKYKDKRKEKIECVCGSIYRKECKNEHEKTIKHISFISQK